MMQEPERTFQAGRRYVLGQGEGFYGIWDREVPGKPVETFDLTEPGLLEARKRTAYLSRQDFWARFGPKALRWALFGGLAVWIVTGFLLWIRVFDLDVFASPNPGPVPLVTPDLAPYFESGWVKATRVAENLALRVWIGALAVILALRLLDRGRQSA